ncbi:hypothetical protein ACFWMQ_18440 [Streptomyces sp. NPDC058372]|uniref:hypothetical protein n=1 Tax=Streptomyces sp. NPDC058372 TaxID=3346464 RepID=UPI003652D99D
MALASPLLVMAVPAGLAACLATRVNPVDALRSTGQLLQALPGAEFTVEDESGTTLIRVE